MVPRQQFVGASLITVILLGLLLNPVVHRVGLFAKTDDASNHVERESLERVECHPGSLVTTCELQCFGGRMKLENRESPNALECFAGAAAISMPSISGRLSRNLNSAVFLDAAALTLFDSGVRLQI